MIGVVRCWVWSSRTTATPACWSSARCRSSAWQPGDHPAHIQIGVLRGLLDGGKHAVAARLKHQKKDPGLGRLDLVVEGLQVDSAVRAGEPYRSCRGRGRRGK